MAYREIDDLETVARSLRKLLCIDDQIQPDMMTVIVKLKHRGIIKDYRRGGGSLPAGKDAEFDPDTGVLAIAEAEFRAMNRGQPKGRFTVAHEAAHAYLRHERLRYRTTPGATISYSPAPVRRDEFQANYVAAAFLAPLHLLPGDPHAMTVEEIASHFNISVSVGRHRKPELERLYRREHRIDRPLPQTLLDFLNENRDKPRK